MFFRGNSGGVVTGDIDMTASSTVAKTEDSVWTIGAPGRTYNWGQYTNARGTTKMGAANVLPAASVLHVGQNDGANATFDLNGFDQSVAGLSSTLGSGGTKQITTSSGPATLTVNNPVDRIFAGRINGAELSLVKDGAGFLSLRGANGLGGDVRVLNGSLKLEAASINNIASASRVELSSNGILDVSGLTNGAITLGSGQTLTGEGRVQGD